MKSIVLRSVGDNLITEPIYKAAKSDDIYDFRNQYDEVKSLIKEADIAVVNQETIMVSDRDQISSFPIFGTPYEIADALVDVGFDVAIQATNHSLDKGFKGIVDDIEIWKKYEGQIEYAGIHSTVEDAERIRVIERNGIKVAILNYTTVLNGHHKPADKLYCVDTMSKKDMPRIKRQLEEARKLADIVAVFPHWGVEYLYEPVAEQIMWAQFLADNGADIIIGAHPHVVQYTDNIKASDGREVPCIYSLGNFISNHTTLAGIVLGAIAEVTIVRDDDGNVGIESYRLIPTVTHGSGHYEAFRVYSLDKYSDELCQSNCIIKTLEKTSGVTHDMAYLNAQFTDICERRALANSIYKKPIDIKLANVRNVIKSLSKSRKKI